MTPLTLGMALAFCAVHVFVPKLRFLEKQPRSRWLSFAGGVAVGYVFLHMLPEIGAHGDDFQDETGLGMALSEAIVFTLALAGLILFYGIEKLVANSRRAQEREGRGDRTEAAVFWLHISVTATVAAIVSYLLNFREGMADTGLGLYFGALLLHFVTADFAARAAYPKLYDRAGRWVLVAATLVGWFVGTQVMLPELLIGCLFAFLGGAIVLVVMKEELPEERESAFWPFLGGAVVYAALVLTEHNFA